MPLLQSYTITQGRDRAPARSMLKATGFTDEDLRALAEKVKEGVRKAGGAPMEFNTIAISDGVTWGDEGVNWCRATWLHLATPQRRSPRSGETLDARHSEMKDQPQTA